MRKEQREKLKVTGMKIETISFSWQHLVIVAYMVWKQEQPATPQAKKTTENDEN